MRYINKCPDTYVITWILMQHSQNVDLKINSPTETKLGPG